MILSFFAIPITHHATSIALAIMVGNELGAGRLDKAKEYGGRLCRLSVLCGVASGIVMLALSPLIFAVTNLSVTSNTYLAAPKPKAEAGNKIFHNIGNGIGGNGIRPKMPHDNRIHGKAHTLRTVSPAFLLTGISQVYLCILNQHPQHKGIRSTDQSQHELLECYGNYKCQQLLGKIM